MDNKITACIPCYNDYPYVILSVRSALLIFDKIIISDCSDDEYTYKSLINHFKNNNKIYIKKHKKGLFSPKSNKKVLNKIVTKRDGTIITIDSPFNIRKKR